MLHTPDPFKGLGYMLTGTFTLLAVWYASMECGCRHPQLRAVVALIGLAVALLGVTYL